jgi:hypothetical protein
MATTCPACHRATVVEIIYGMPLVELAEAERRGEVILGGCCLDPGDPTSQCTNCGWNDRSEIEFHPGVSGHRSEP